MQVNPCDLCAIKKGCDILSEMCRLTASEIARRPDLCRNPVPRVPIAHLQPFNIEKRGIAALGFKKYNKRYKLNTPQLELWRMYKTKRREKRENTRGAE